jgi:hypothetical protein
MSSNASAALYAIGTIVGFVVSFFIGCHCGERTARRDVECLADDAAAVLAKTADSRESWFAASVLAAYIRATRILGSKRGFAIIDHFRDAAQRDESEPARMRANDLEIAHANIMKAEHCDDES